jgi:FixJ family two-component response regulator
MPVVFVINDDDSVRESLASLIRAAGWQPETFADARTFLRHPRVLVPSCVVLDAELPDMCGLDLQALFMDRPDMPVIFTAKRPVLRAAVLAMKAGAVEFLAEPLDEGLLLSAIRVAMLRSRAALVHEAEMSVLCDLYATLSNREREVMAHVIAGKLNKVIADDLAISEITVKAHRGKVMRKMEAASLPHLVNMAARLGLATYSYCDAPSTQALLRKTRAPHVMSTGPSLAR